MKNQQKNHKNNLHYSHVDVFSNAPFSGNGLTVFFIDKKEISKNIMQKITIEMRQFESIFLQPTEVHNTFKAWIFTMQEELDFAGHPIIGAACALHEKLSSFKENVEWNFLLNNKKVSVTSTNCHSHYHAVMEQGTPIFEAPLNKQRAAEYIEALNLSLDNVVEHLPLQVVSTGLPNLLVPIKSGLEKAKIVGANFEEQLKKIDAKFVYVYDINRNEARTWDNEGLVEDIATGSAAGTMMAYLVKYGVFSAEKFNSINQGSFLGRPSQINVKVSGTPENIISVAVSGNVHMISKGVITCLT